MAESETLNGRELGLYTDDFGRDRKPKKKSNTGRNLGIAGLALLIGGTGLYLGKSYMNKPETITSLREQQAITDTRPAPKPESSVSSRIIEAAYPASPKTDIGLPKAKGYTVDGDWIVPDFELNSDYDFSDVNDFLLALVEVSKSGGKSGEWQAS